MTVKVIVPFKIVFGSRMVESGEISKDWHFPSDPSQGMTFYPFDDGRSLKILETGFLPDGAAVKRFIRTETFELGNEKALDALTKAGWKVAEKGQAPE